MSECDACGDQRTLRFEPDEEDLKDMTKDHRFMCTGDFGFYEVESEEETELYTRKQVEQVLDDKDGDSE
jgi:hypothetical protein